MAWFYVKMYYVVALQVPVVWSVAAASVIRSSGSGVAAPISELGLADLPSPHHSGTIPRFMSVQETHEGDSSTWTLFPRFVNVVVLSLV